MNGIDTPYEEFIHAYIEAIRHIDSFARQGFEWIDRSPRPPFLAHMSFLLGNQAFYVQLEDVDSMLEVPGNLEGLLRIADGCNGHACKLVLKKRIDGGWQPALPGWSLLHAVSRQPVDPPSLVTAEKIELTDWEVSVIAVNTVADRLSQEGKHVTSAVGHLGIYPNIWLDHDNNLEWVIVGAARHPAADPSPTADMINGAQYLANKGLTSGYFASVVLASINDPFDPAAASNGNYHPLYRGVATVARIQGLRAIEV
jgi:hypothetical protein